MKFFFLLLATLAWTIPTSAEDTKLSLARPRESIWENELGSGLRYDSLNVGLSLGGAFGMKVLGGSESHDFVLGSVHAGWVISGVKATNHWYRGNWELVGELFGGGQVNPTSAYLIGLTPFIRYDFATGTRWVPFVEAGAGVTATDIGKPDLGTTFEFNLQAGVGVHYFLREYLAVTLQYRYMHFSDANIGTPNLGVNSNAVLAGISWWF